MDKQINEADLLALIRTLPIQMDDSYRIEEEIAYNSEVDKNSYVRIVNNEIVVQYSPTYVNKSLTIQAEAPINLKINQLEAGSKVSLSRGDRVTWIANHPPLFEINVSDDEMSVYLTVYHKERYAYKIKDTQPCEHLIVTLEEDKNQVLSTLTSADIMIKLQDLNIKGKIEYGHIFKEVMAPSAQPIIILQGQKPTPGQDAELKLFFSDRIESKLNGKENTVDFRDHLFIPQVNPGDLIARKKEAIYGEPGINVYGHIILPEPPKDIIILAKDNVEMNAAGEIFALTAGRPQVLGHRVKYFNISKEFVVPGDVSMETGNITFSGDVVVYGHVLDNMIIESLGNVYVMGNVHQSTITATGSIFIQGNVTNSFLYSGYFGVVFNRLYGAAKDLADTILNLKDATNVILNILKARGKSAREGFILNSLIETKYHSFYSQIRVILHIFRSLESEQVIPEWREFKRMLEAYIQPMYMSNYSTIEGLTAFESMARDIYMNIELMQEHSERIEINQCAGSTLKSNGDIKVLKEGTVQSFLFAKNQIVYEHLDSVCRGGEIEAGHSVHLIAVGGRSGTETIIKANKNIFAKKIFMAKVCIGSGTEHIYNPLKDVIVSSDRGRLRVQGESLGLVD